MPRESEQKGQASSKTRHFSMFSTFCPALFGGSRIICREIAPLLEIACKSLQPPEPQPLFESFDKTWVFECFWHSLFHLITLLWRILTMKACPKWTFWLEKQSFTIHNVENRLKYEYILQSKIWEDCRIFLLYKYVMV